MFDPMVDKVVSGGGDLLKVLVGTAVLAAFVFWTATEPPRL